MLFAINLALALALAAFFGNFYPPMLVLAFLTGFALLLLISLILGKRPRYFRVLPQVIWLSGYFIKELVKSCVLVARDCVARAPDLHPGVVKMPIGPKSDAEIFVLANLITLTPGTMTLDVADDRSFLLIHSIYAKDPEALVQDLKSGMEHRVAEVFR